MAHAEPVMTLYDLPMWEAIARESMELQACDDCSAFRYPPGPSCPHCLSMRASWRAVSGRGTILSWVVFHRQYFDDFPPPYNAIAVKLDEGPIVVSNLVGTEPSGSWINQPVHITYRRHFDRTQHAFTLSGPQSGSPSGSAAGR